MLRLWARRSPIFCFFFNSMFLTSFTDVAMMLLELFDKRGLD